MNAKLFNSLTTRPAITIIRVIIHALGLGKTFTAFPRLFACFFMLFDFPNLQPVSNIVSHSALLCTICE